jgi:hypothetical protein
MENLALHSPIGAIISLSLWGGGMRARLTFADHFLHLGKYGIWHLQYSGGCRLPVIADQVESKSIER